MSTETRELHPRATEAEIADLKKNPMNQVLKEFCIESTHPKTEEKVTAWFIVRKPTTNILLDVAGKTQSEGLDKGSKLLSKLCTVHGNRDLFDDPVHGPDFFMGVAEQIGTLTGEKKILEERIL